MADTCQCHCHTNIYAACSVPGGCGSVGCGQTSGTCPCCQLRDPYDGLVCDPCRNWLPVALASVDEKHRRLPAMLAPVNAPNERVTGSTDPAAPLNLDAEDLLTRVARPYGQPVDSTTDTMIQAGAIAAVRVDVAAFVNGRHVVRTVDLWQRVALVDEHGHPVLKPAGDQVGYLPVAQVLDAWARDWARERDMREHPPAPTVTALVGWLADRLDWACGHYEPIGDFAASLRVLRGNMMNVLGEFDPPPAHCDGVPCQRCDQKQLFDAQDGSADVLCRNPDCLKVYRRAEYELWTDELAEQERGKRDAQQIRDLLRRRLPAETPPADTP